MTKAFHISVLLMTSAVIATAADVSAPAAEVASATDAAAAAGIGAWTTDWPAAVKVAQERKLPLFIEFTGSDWCGWCIKMEKECLSQPEFLEAMKTRCVLVSVDFPHKTQLPASLKEQNDKLASQFKKGGGLPRYYMVDSDATTVHWSWGAHPKYGKDLKLLISDIDDFVAGCTCVVDRVAKDLPANKAEAYRTAAKPYAEKRKAVSVWLDEEHPDAKAAKEQFNTYVEELKTLKTAMNQAL